MNRLGKYEVLDTIGTGSMGTVYRAHDASLDREIALKVIRTGVDTDPEIRERFFREARACARLQHPNIITVHDVGESGETAYIAMELLSGRDFRAIIKEKSPIPLEAKIEVVAEICEAVGHAHKRGVLHRDIKPSNLFLVSTGHAKVLDFGIARLSSSQLTVAGKILGTPNYMAPERVLAAPSDGRADLFSIAVFLFELLTYVHPFQDVVIPRRIVEGEPDSLFDHDPTLPVVLDKLITRGLARNPDHRYRTGDEFAADLRAVLDALRQNASPTFSRLQLPSQRALPQEPLSAGSEPLVPRTPVPQGWDPADWRLSEALRLLPQFDAALEKKDVTNARELLREMEGSLGGDNVYREALGASRSRLEQMQTAEPPAQAIGPEDVPPPSVRPPPAERAAAAPVVAPVQPRGGEKRRPLRFYERLARLISSSVHGRRRRAVVSGLTAVSALLIIVAVATVFSSPRIEPAIATARVSVSDAVLRNGPNSTATQLASLQRDSRVNLLARPVARNQQWVRVQPVGPKILTPGYLRATDLKDWQAPDAPTALTIVRDLGSGPGGSPRQIEDQIRGLEEVTRRFADRPEANEARVEIAEMRIAQASAGKTAGSPEQDWRAQAQDALDHLAPAGEDPRLKERVEELRKAALAILPPVPAPIIVEPPPPPPPPPPRPRIDISKTLVEAEQLRQAGNYPQALRLLQQVLAADSGNQTARKMLDKINRGLSSEKEN